MAKFRMTKRRKKIGIQIKRVSTMMRKVKSGEAYITKGLQYRVKKKW